MTPHRMRSIVVGAAAIAAIAGLALIVRPWTLLGDAPDDRATTGNRPAEMVIGEGTGASNPATDSLKAPSAGKASESATAPPPIDLAGVDRELDLHGTVADAAGAPIPNATLLTVTYPFRRASILAIDRFDEAVEGPGTRSAKDGTFALRLRRGTTVALRVSANGFASVEFPSCHAGERRAITLSKGVTLIVEATDSGERPVADATMRLFRSAYRGDSAFEVRAKTGADGQARFEGLTPSVSAYLEIESSRCGDIGWKDVALPSSGAMTLRLDLPDGRTITGRVTDAETKAPIPDARVGMNWVLNREVRTDADGRFNLTGWTGQGIEDVHVLAEGYGRGHALVGKSTVLDFALSKGDTVVGRVVGPDGSPIAGATVAAIGSQRRPDGQQHTSTADGTSGPDGRFALTGLRRDLPHTLVVMGIGFGRTLLDFDPRPAGQGVIDLGDVRVPTARLLSGRVVTHEGTPVPRVLVELRGANADRGRLRLGRPAIEDSFYGSEESDFTDDLGRFRFADLAPGTYSIVAYARGTSVPSRENVVSGDADPAVVELRLPAGRELRVVVVDDTGAPVPWACVSVRDSSMALGLDSDGSVRFTLADGATGFSVHAWDGLAGGDPRRFVDSERAIEVEDGRSEVRVVLHSGSPIRGRAVKSDGTGVGRARVECLSGETYVNSTWADDEGGFEVTVPKTGRYRLLLSGSTMPPRGGATTVELGLAGEVDGVLPGAIDVMIRALPVVRDLTQEVVVIDADGRPMTGAIVSATWSDSIGRTADLRTDARGRVVVPGLPGRSCWIKASSADERDDWLEESRRVSIPASGAVELRLRRGIRVRGRVLVPNGATMPILIEVSQQKGESIERRTVEVTDPSTTTFSILLDPDDGVLVGVRATSGPEEAPTHRARAEGSALAAGEIVLTLASVR